MLALMEKETHKDDNKKTNIALHPEVRAALGMAAKLRSARGRRVTAGEIVDELVREKFSDLINMVRQESSVERTEGERPSCDQPKSRGKRQ